MIEESIFNNIKTLYGTHASWAVWAKRGKKPKSNLKWADIDKEYPEPWKILKPNIIFVGLNASDHEKNKPENTDWNNFHSLDGGGNDFKIRFALENTPFWGAYMTDIIKYADKNLTILREKDSKIVLENWNNHTIPHEENIERFCKEISALIPTEPNIMSSEPAILLAFGRDAYEILLENRIEIRKRCMNSNIREIVFLEHFSNRDFTKEEYRKDCIDRLIKYTTVKYTVPTPQGESAFLHAEDWSLKIPCGKEMAMLHIEPEMSGLESETGDKGNKKQHPYELGKSLVKQEQWEAVMGDSTSEKVVAATHKFLKDVVSSGKKGSTSEEVAVTSAIREFLELVAFGEIGHGTTEEVVKAAETLGTSLCATVGNNPSKVKDAKCPVERVSWYGQRVNFSVISFGL